MGVGATLGTDATLGTGEALGAGAALVAAEAAFGAAGAFTGTAWAALGGAGTGEDRDGLTGVILIVLGTLGSEVLFAGLELFESSP